MIVRNWLLRLGTILLLVLFVGGVAETHAQTVRPVSKAGLFKVLRDHSLPNDELVSIVRERGVDFAMSSDEESEMIKLGGDSSLVEAVKSSLKLPAKADFKLLDGPPLSQTQILLLLEAQVDQDTIRKLVELRGTTITVDGPKATELSSAGVNEGLIGMLLLHHKEAPPKPAPPKNEPPVVVATNTLPPTPQSVTSRTAATVPMPTPQKPASQIAQPPVAPPPAAVPEGPIRVDIFTQAQKLKSTVKPVYPTLAQRMKVQGRVVVEVLVGKDGNVKSLRPVSGPLQLQQAAKEAVARWTWEPTLINGVAVEVISQVVVDFKFANPSR